MRQSADGHAAALQHCGTTIEGEFSVGRFSRLNRDQYALLESFLRSRGNLRELERELGVSYPTVRNRVEALLRALDLADGTPMPPSQHAAPAQPSDPETRRAILERLARHELTAEQAAAALRGEPIESQNTCHDTRSPAKPGGNAERGASRRTQGNE